MFGGFRTRADATYRLLQAPGTAFLVVAAPERDALREAAYFVERLADEDMPLAGLVLNRVHGSGAAQLTAERALAAAEELEDWAADEAEGSGESAESAGPGESAGSAGGGPGGSDVALTGKNDDRRIVDHGAGHADSRQDRPDDAGTERLAAGLLRLHAERMQVVARERRTRDRFVSVHPEVPMIEVTALPGDVHDLEGLRAIGEELAEGQPAAA
jgi:hypothetical protein